MIENDTYIWQFLEQTGPCPSILVSSLLNVCCIRFDYNAHNRIYFVYGSKLSQWEVLVGFLLTKVATDKT